MAYGRPKGREGCDPLPELSVLDAELPNPASGCFFLLEFPCMHDSTFLPVSKCLMIRCFFLLEKHDCGPPSLLTTLIYRENATRDRYEAVTLHETYRLDALELDVYPVSGWSVFSFDNCISTRSSSAEREPYVAITFDDDIMPDLPRHEREADVRAHGDHYGRLRVYFINVADKETEPPDSSLRMRSLDQMIYY
ncbi:hypothetical protein Dimus_031694 [Dionaea muscipula]